MTMTPEQVQALRDRQYARIVFELATCAEDKRAYWQRMREKWEATGARTSK